MRWPSAAPSPRPAIASRRCGSTERLRAAGAGQVVRMGPRIARITTTRNPVIGGLRNGAIRLTPRALLLKAL